MTVYVSQTNFYHGHTAKIWGNDVFLMVKDKRNVYRDKHPMVESNNTVSIDGIGGIIKF